MRAISVTIALVVAVLLAAGIFLWTADHALFYASDSGLSVPFLPSLASASTSSTTATPDKPASADPSLPALLIIPSLKISSHVQYVGVNAAGNMRAPDNFTDVAWYEPGAIPGQVGSAVIDGHVDNGLGLAGVFKRLDQLKVGDDIYIQTNAGKKIHFVVTDIESYPYTSVPAPSLFERSDGTYLNLITCEGTWVPSGDTYDHRLVVYTKLVS